jgi:hypothetical protein
MSKAIEEIVSLSTGPKVRQLPPDGTAAQTGRRTSRRDMLRHAAAAVGATSAAVAAPSAAAAATAIADAAGTDAELLAAIAEFRRVSKVATAATARADRVLFAAQKQFPPPILDEQGGPQTQAKLDAERARVTTECAKVDPATSTPLFCEMMARLAQSAEQAHAEGTRALAEHEAACNAILDHAGWPALEQAAERAEDAYYAAYERVRAVQPQTLAGMLAQVRWWNELGSARQCAAEGSADAAFMIALEESLARLAGEPRSTAA